MLRFIDFLFEGKHEYIDGHKLGPESPEEHIKAALNHNHAGVIAYGVRHYNPKNHPNLAGDFDAATKHKDWWVRAEAAKHSHLTDEQKQRLQNDKNSKVSGSFGSSVETKLVKTEKPKAEKPKAEKPAKVSKTEKPKAEKVTAEKKPALSVVSGKSEDFPYANKVSHIHDSKGKPVGTVVSGAIPHEVGEDKPFHRAYVGNYDKTGLNHIGDHPTHQHALLALVNHLKK